MTGVLLLFSSIYLTSIYNLKIFKLFMLLVFHLFEIYNKIEKKNYVKQLV